MDYLKPFQGNHLYKITIPPVGLPVSLELVKEHLRLGLDDDSQDSYLTFFIESAWLCFEEITKRTLLDTTFETFRNFLNPALQLRRSPFINLVSFQYTVNAVLVDVDPLLFYIFEKNQYSYILLRESKSYPSNGDDILQGIKIQFSAGFTAPLSPEHSDIKLALLNHISALYENRGDCDKASIESSLPNTSRFIYNKYKILETI